MAHDKKLLDWMRSTDPALGWQVERDLMGAPDATWQATRDRVATEGIGARLLALQDDDGQWSGGAFFPTRADARALNHPDDGDGQPYDHLRDAALHDGLAPDPRAAEAVELVRAARGEDGRWLQGTRYKGQVWFEVDVPVGEPSPWLTFHALRVLDWWDQEAL